MIQIIKNNFKNYYGSELYHIILYNYKFLIIKKFIKNLNGILIEKYKKAEVILINCS